MAATGYTPIILFHSTPASAVPTTSNLAVGELGLNNTDGKLYYNTGSAIAVLAGAGGAGIAGGSNTQVQYNNSGSLAGSANFTYGSGQVFIQQTVAGNAQNLALENGSTTGTVTSSLAFTSSGVAKASITSAVYGNGYMAFATNDNTEKMRIDSSGNLLVGTTSTSGSVNNNTQIVGGIFSTSGASGISALNATATTLVTLPNISAGCWLISATLPGQGAAAAYSCVAIVTTQATSSSISTIKTAALASLSLSGLAVQITQTSGGTQGNCAYTAIRLF